MIARIDTARRALEIARREYADSDRRHQTSYEGQAKHLRIALIESVVAQREADYRGDWKGAQRAVRGAEGVRAALVENYGQRFGQNDARLHPLASGVRQAEGSAC